MKPIARLLVLITCFGGLTFLGPAAAQACGQQSSSTVSSGAIGGAIQVSAASGGSSACETSGTSGSTVPGVWHSEPVCEFGGAATCTQIALCDNGAPMAYVWFETSTGTHQSGSNVCPTAGGQTPSQVVTADLVARAIRRIRLPASELVVQPPDGRTLVNFATNFYTETDSLTRTITLLGQRVDLRITPASYGWRFGDGGSATTTTPGAAYPDLQVTHDYLVAGEVSPAVDTIYTADFRVNAGAWAPVPGTVTIPGASVPLEVVEATPTLVGYR